MIDQIIFSQPALLIGIGAAGVPILIHLLLRPRPKRTSFPAISLLRQVVVFGQRARRMHNLMLMILRALLLGLVALLLANPTCTSAPSEFVGTEPLACVIILDDSASMDYLVDNDVMLDLSRTAAIDFVERSVAWPEHSALTILHAKLNDMPLPLTTDRTAVIEALRDPASTYKHTHPLGDALQAAADILRSADPRAKRIAIFTDGAAHAWRDVTPATLAGLDDMALRVVRPLDQQRSNLAILAAAGPRRLHPATAPVPIQATLSAEGLDGQCWLLVRKNDQVLKRLGPLDIPADTIREVMLELPAMPSGTHTLTLEIEPSDHMNFDQIRYLAFQTAPPPRVWLIGPAHQSAEDDLSMLILHNLLAPQVLTHDQQLVELHTFDSAHPPSQLEVDMPSESLPALIIILSNTGFTPPTVSALLRLIERGTTVLLVPGSSDRAVDWPGLRPQLSSAPPVVEPLTALNLIRWEPSSDYHNAEDLAELTRCAVRRRLVLDHPRDDVLIHARYTDGQPAVVSKRRGAGQLWLLTTSPDPGWSDLGIRAAGLITWLHLLVEQSLGLPAAVAAFTHDQQSRRGFAGLPSAGLIRVTSDSDAEYKPAWRRLSAGRPEQPWPTDYAGIFELHAPGTDQQTTAYVVNWPPEESCLDPINLTALQQLLGTEHVRLETPDLERHARQSKLFKGLFSGDNPCKALAGLLLALFLFELVLPRQRHRSVC